MNQLKNMDALSDIIFAYEKIFYACVYSKIFTYIYIYIYIYIDKYHEMPLFYKL